MHTFKRRKCTSKIDYILLALGLWPNMCDMVVVNRSGSVQNKLSLSLGDPPLADPSATTNRHDSPIFILTIEGVLNGLPLWQNPMYLPKYIPQLLMPSKHT
mgnify:CR=1 FL=1